MQWIAWVLAALAADPVVEPGGDWVVEEDARASIEQAISMLRGGRFEEAAASLQALDAASDAPELAYLHALAWYEAGNLSRAEAAAFAGADGGYGPLLNLKGLILADLGRGEEALRLFEAAERTAADDAALKGRVTLNRGLVEADSGRFGAAQERLEAAVALGETSGDASVVQGAVDNLARIASLTGEGGARDVLGAVVDHLRRGDLDEARGALEADRGTDRRARARQALARAAIARVEGRMDEAVVAADEALRLAREGGLVRERLAALGDLVALHIAMERPALAASTLQEALDLVQGTHFAVRELGLRIQSGFLAVDAGDLDKARAEAERARTLLRASPQPVAAARLDELDGRIAGAGGDGARSQAALERSFDALGERGYHADAARVATEALRRAGTPELREAWRRRALAAFEAAHDPSGPAFVAVSEGLSLAAAEDLDGALAAFVRAAEAAEAAGPRAARVGTIARENASAALAALGYSPENAAAAASLGLEEVLRGRERFQEGEQAYEAGREAYAAGRFSEARTAFERAMGVFIGLGEVGHANSCRRALAWATYQDAIRSPATASYPFFEELEQEAIQVDDPELAVRARAARAMSAAELGLPAAEGLLRDVAARADTAQLTIVAGQVWAELALLESLSLSERAGAAREAHGRLAGEDLGVHALYAVAVAAYNAEDYALARELVGLAAAAPGGLAEPVGQLSRALDEVEAHRAQAP